MSNMPQWITYLIWAAAVVTASTVLIGFPVVFWTKVIKPTLKFFRTAEEMVPLLRELTKEFKDQPEAFGVLKEIAAQFHTDHGTTLRDVINELQVTASDLTARAEASKILDEQLAAQIARLTVKVDDNTAKGEVAAATGKRLEQHANNVAQDLAEAHKRADAVSGEPGEAADASVQIPKEDKNK